MVKSCLFCDITIKLPECKLQRGRKIFITLKLWSKTKKVIKIITRYGKFLHFSFPSSQSNGENLPFSQTATFTRQQRRAMKFMQNKFLLKSWMSVRKKFLSLLILLIKLKVKEQLPCECKSDETTMLCTLKLMHNILQALHRRLSLVNGNWEGKYINRFQQWL